MGFTRRQFLVLGGAAGAGIAIPAWLRETIANSGPEFFPAPNESLCYQKNLESFVPSVCQGCSGACMLKVRVVDGNAVGVAGHPTHPVTRGAVCPKGPASLQELYHPDRIPQPMLRIGERGDGQWKFISWEDAISKVTQELQALRASGNAHTLAIVDGSRQGMTRRLFERFAAAYGTPNYTNFNWTMGELPLDAFGAVHGTDQMGYDLEKAQYVLSFGLDSLQCFPSPIESSRAYGLIRCGRAGHRGRVVQIESRLSMTGGKADEWIPVKPGTEGVLALALAHVLLKEKRLNRQFVSTQTTGFAPFSQMVLHDFSPEKVAKTTGVAVETIYRLAREFSAANHAVALGERSSLFNQLAVHSLNALVGNIGAEGGVVSLKAPQTGALPPFGRDSRGQAGLQHKRVDGAGATFSLSSNAPQQLPENLLAKKPYPVKSVFLHNCNPVFASPAPQRWREALKSVPFVVSFSSFMNETAELADLILPDHTALESWRDAPAVTLNGDRVVGVAKPAVAPVYKTRQTTDVLMQIAHSLNGAMKAAFPWDSFESLLKSCAQQAHASGQARPLLLDPSEEPSDEKLSFEDFWEAVTAGGGWSLPSQLRSGTGRFDFRAELLQSAFANRKSQIAKPQSEMFPLSLCLFTPLAFSHAEGAHLPYLNSIAGPQLDERWETWAGMNPETAHSCGLADGDEIWVESPVGRVRAKARWFQGAMPGLVNMPVGFGHTAYGRWAKGVGSNPVELVEKSLDPVTGQPDWQSQRVRVYRA